MRIYFCFLLFSVAVKYTFATPKQVYSKELNYADNKNYKLCTTKDCVNAASKVSAKLNRAVDPCDNFFKFACGGWIKNHPVNESYPLISSFKVIDEQTTQKVIDILEDTSKLDDTLSLKNARKLYAMCMDVKTLKIMGVHSLSTFLQRNGGWPIARSLLTIRENGKYTWQQISDVMNKNMFSNGLYDIFVRVDDKKSDSHVITIEEPSFVAPRDFMISMAQNSAQKMIYKSLIEEVARILANDRGAYVEDMTIAQDALDIVNFEIELAKLTMSNVDSRDVDKIYNEMTVAKLQQEYDAQRSSPKSKINWLNILQRLFISEGIQIQATEKLIVQAYKYLIGLVPVLERTPVRTIVNYMQWTAVRTLLSYSGGRLEEIAFEISKQFHGQPPESLRWKTCARRYNLNSAISHAYAKKYVQRENVKDIDTLIQDVANVVRTQISTSTWMDEPTIKASLDKLSSMKSKVSVPTWYSNEAIDKYYDGLIIRDSTYLENIVNLLKYDMKKILNKLRKPVDKNEWEMEPTVVNAYYSPPSNEIVFTAAILQDPMYDRNRPALMNYGSLGFVVGHEIGHGFDNLGRKYDKNGNSIEWWTKTTIERYEQLAQCFVNQYNSYEVPNLDPVVHVDGQLTLGENIGDSAGIVAAYNAYKKMKTRRNEPEMRLPGLEDYSDDQIFFMAAAHTFCENITPQKTKLLLHDEHPRPEVRIVGSFSNFPEFSAAYNCPAGKRMNPEKKCILWH